MSIIIGIDHGYYAIKTAHCSFPAGLTSYGEHEPYTRQGLLEFGGCFFVCGSGRQPIQRDKTVNDNYYLLTLAAIAKEIQQRGLPPECSVRIAAGLPLTSFGRDKPKFRDYLLRSKQPVNYKFEGVEYSITIEEVAIFPQGYAALMTETGLLQDEPSMLLMDLGGWTVDLMRIDNAIPAADTAHSLELGMIRCVDDIREQVRRETGLSLTDAQIENMLAGHPCTVSEAVRGIVNQQGRKYTEHLLSATMEAGFDLHAIPAVLLGGGASVVSRHLSPKDGLCKTIFLLDDKVNAVGCPISSCSAADFLARLSALQDLEKDSEIHAALSSLNWPAWLKPGSLRICCLKMYPACYLMTEGGHLRRSLTRWTDWGMAWNGNVLTAKISAFPSLETACTLSDILMSDVEEK